MSPLLDQALLEARKLSDTEQDVIAAIILAEIRDEQQWEKSFSSSPGKLDALISKAKAQVQSGQCQTAGIDQL